MKNKFLSTLLVCLLVLVGAVALSACGTTTDPSNPGPSNPSNPGPSNPSNPGPTQTYTLTLDYDSNYGSVYVNGELPASTSLVGGKYKLTFNEDENVAISAHAKAGYLFINWSDDSIEPTRKLTMTDDVDLTANFSHETGVGETKIINGHRVTAINAFIDNGMYIYINANVSDLHFGYWTKNDETAPISTKNQLRFINSEITQDVTYTFHQTELCGYRFGILEDGDLDGTTIPAHLKQVQKYDLLDTSALKNVRSHIENDKSQEEIFALQSISTNFYNTTIPINEQASSNYLVVLGVFEVGDEKWCTIIDNVKINRNDSYLYNYYYKIPDIGFEKYELVSILIKFVYEN